MTDSINWCNLKKNAKHIGEVSTSRVDGSPTGAEILTSTNEVTGQVRDTLAGKFKKMDDAFNSITSSQFIVTNFGNWSTVAGQQIEEADRLKGYMHPDDSGDVYAVKGSVSLPITRPSTPIGDDRFYLASAVNEAKLKEFTDSVNNIHTKRQAIEWKSGLGVTDSLQLYIHEDIEYLPNKVSVPFTTSAAFESDKFELSLKFKQWREAGDVRGWGIFPNTGKDLYVKLKNLITENKGRRLKFPAGAFRFSGTLSIPRDSYITGEGAKHNYGDGGTDLQYIGDGTAITIPEKGAGGSVILEDFSVTDVNGTGACGIDFGGGSNDYLSNYSRITVFGFQDAYRINIAYINNYTSLLYFQPRRYGFYLVKGNADTAASAFNSCGGWGTKDTSAGWYISKVTKSATFTACFSEYSKIAVYIDAPTAGFQFANFLAERPQDYGFYIKGALNNIELHNPVFFLDDQEKLNNKGLIAIEGGGLVKVVGLYNNWKLKGATISVHSDSYLELDNCVIHSVLGKWTGVNSWVESSIDNKTGVGTGGGNKVFTNKPLGAARVSDIRKVFASKAASDYVLDIDLKTSRELMLVATPEKKEMAVRVPDYNWLFNDQVVKLHGSDSSNRFIITKRSWSDYDDMDIKIGRFEWVELTKCEDGKWRISDRSAPKYCKGVPTDVGYVGEVRLESTPTNVFQYVYTSSGWVAITK